MKFNATPTFFMDAPNADQVFERLRNAGIMTEADYQKAALALIALDEREGEATPLYLKALSAIGAILTGLLLLLLLYLLGMFNLDPAVLMVNGLLLIGAAKLSHHGGLRKSGLLGEYLVQLGLTLLQAGKVAFISGWAFSIFDLFNDPTGSLWPITLGVWLVGGVTFVLFPSGLERFIAAFSALLASWWTLMHDVPALYQSPAFLGCVAAHLIILAACLRWGWIRRRFEALFSALLLSLCAGIGYIAAWLPMAEAGHLGGADQSIGIGLSSLALKWPVQGLLTVALMALILWVAGRHRARPSEAIILSLVGAVLLGVLSDPGILLALGIMVLGYATHRPQHSLLGLLFAIGFGWHFYYALELTLLQKSLTLVTSGMLLLAAAAYVHRRGWAAPNRELANE